MSWKLKCDPEISFHNVLTDLPASQASGPHLKCFQFVLFFCSFTITFLCRTVCYTGLFYDNLTKVIFVACLLASPRSLVWFWSHTSNNLNIPRTSVQYTCRSECHTVGVRVQFMS